MREKVINYSYHKNKNKAATHYFVEENLKTPNKHDHDVEKYERLPENIVTLLANVDSFSLLKGEEIHLILELKSPKW